jgi:hypothetical protein
MDHNRLLPSDEPAHIFEARMTKKFEQEHDILARTSSCSSKNSELDILGNPACGSTVQERVPLHKIEQHEQRYHQRTGSLDQEMCRSDRSQLLKSSFTTPMSVLRLKNQEDLLEPMRRRSASLVFLSERPFQLNSRKSQTSRSMMNLASGSVGKVTKNFQEFIESHEEAKSQTCSYLYEHFNQIIATPREM